MHFSAIKNQKIPVKRLFEPINISMTPNVIVIADVGDSLFGTERPMLDGPFNDVLTWNYHRIPEIIGHGRGFKIETEEQLEIAFSAAENIHIPEPYILDVRLDIHDGSPALQRLAESLRKKVQ